MHFQIQVIVTQDDGTELPPIEVVTLQRTEFTPETVGLSLADGKRILSGIQTTMTQAQVATYTDLQRQWPAQAVPPRDGPGAGSSLDGSGWARPPPTSPR